MSTGKRALIFGAASGIGAAVSSRLAREGYELLLADVDARVENQAHELASEFHVNVVAVPVDVRVENDVDEAVTVAQSRLHGHWAMVNAAGISTTTVAKPLHEVAPVEWRDVLAVNLEGLLLTCKYVIPRMMESGGGTILAFGSTFSYLGAPGLAAYAASKAGVLQVVRSIALDYGPSNIRANAIIPGYIDTPLLRRDLARAADTQKARAAIEARTPAGRLGEADEIASLAAFVLSDEAKFITGSALVADGGYLIS